VTLAPELPGDIAVIEMSGNKLMVQSGSYMASETGIDLTAKISVKAFMSAEGISMLEATGSGALLVSSYGAIYEKTLAAGEKYIVDTTTLLLSMPRWVCSPDPSADSNPRCSAAKGLSSS
jgi:uncharacterized protein (AIM24 family)